MLSLGLCEQLVLSYRTQIPAAVTVSHSVNKLETVSTSHCQSDFVIRVLAPSNARFIRGVGVTRT